MKMATGWNAKWVPTPVSGVCSHCGRKVTFDSPGEAYHDLGDARYTAVAAMRVCPDRTCRGIVYFEIANGAIQRQFPPVFKSFPALEMPEHVAQPLQEALSCQAHDCHAAAAMLIRRTIEAMCLDRGAEGADLWHRIENLRQRVVIPNELYEAMHDLRLLGNDAAHVGGKAFEQIGPEEVDVALELVEQLLMAVYGYGKLLGRLRGLKKQPSPEPERTGA